MCYIICHFSSKPTEKAAAVIKFTSLDVLKCQNKFLKTAGNSIWTIQESAHLITGFPGLQSTHPWCFSAGLTLIIIKLLGKPAFIIFFKKKSVFLFPFNYHRSSVKGHWVRLWWEHPHCRNCYNNSDGTFSISLKEQVAQIPYSAVTISWEKGRKTVKRKEIKKLAAQRMQTSSRWSDMATLPQTVCVDSGSEKKETPKNTHGSVGSQWNVDMWQFLKPHL